MNGLVLNNELQKVVQRECSAMLADIDQAVTYVQSVVQLAESNAHVAAERVRYAEMRLDLASSGRYLMNAYERDVVTLQQAQRFVQDLKRLLWTIEERAACIGYGSTLVAAVDSDNVERQCKELYRFVQQVDTLSPLVHSAIEDYVLADEPAHQSLRVAQQAMLHSYAALRVVEKLMMEVHASELFASE